MHKRSCLCGAVKFEVEGRLSSPDACHCSQCRKWTGHYLASTDVPPTVPMQKSTVGGQQEMTLVDQASQGVQRCFIQHICANFRWLALA